MNRELIPCTVGMLAWNSAHTIERTLESVRDFAEIVVADGGSADETRNIAKQYGAKIIDQTNPGHPIKDFSAERNLVLSIATQPWFLWLDSDEYISDRLREQIEQVCHDTESTYSAYDLRIVRTDPKTLEPYKDLKANYQLRLFSTAIGASYQNRVHEKVFLDRKRYPVGRLDGAWYVPLQRQRLRDYMDAVDARFPSLVHDKPATNIRQYLKLGILRPTTAVLKIVVRVLVLRIRHPFGHVIPLSIECGRLYTQWVIMREHTRTYWGSHHD